MNNPSCCEKEKAGSTSAMEAQKEVFDAHRVYSSYYFKNIEMDFVFQWLLGSISTGGCVIGEAFYAAGRIKDGDPESWQREWKELAERKESRAEEAMRKGHKVSASKNFLLAANYYRSSLTSRLPWDADYLSLGKKSYGCIEKAGSLMEPAMIPIGVPFENAVLPGFFWPVANDGKPRKTLLMVGGGECFLTDNLFYIGPLAVERGYNFVTVDIPGQGLLPAEGLFFRGNAEKPIGAILDVVTKMPEVDSERLSVLGISFGGYFAPRAASVDKRIKALITNAAVIDNYEMFAAMPFSKLTQDEIDKTWSPFGKGVTENVVWRLGLKPGNFTGQAEATKGFSYDPADITCPVLNVVGEGEAANPIGHRQGQIYMERVNTDRKKKVVTPFNEGAAAHCTGENRVLMACELFDWLDEVFKEG